jgi:hypothetical protein
LLGFGPGLGLLSFACLAVALGLWVGRMNRVALEGHRALPFALCAAAAATGIAAFVVGPGWLGGLLAALGLAGGLAWIGLGLLAGQSRQTPRVVVGEPLPAIVAPDPTGASFDVARLRGHPVLIKLFRGHW